MKDKNNRSTGNATTVFNVRHVLGLSIIKLSAFQEKE
jgi:hypothetical protein